MKFGIIRERKNPPDKRVVLSPTACQKILSDHTKAKIAVESSPIRTFTNDEYTAAGIQITSNIEDCQVLFGVKEVPIENLIPIKNIFSFLIPLKSNPIIEVYYWRFSKRI